MTNDDYPTEVDDQQTLPPAQDEPSDAADAIRKARALIPVGAGGAMPTNFAQQVDFAKTMAQARSTLPPHLVGNAGDCLAIIDIASRANLSPYMVANMTYVEPKSKRLSFMSQLYHAFLTQSGMLIGDLEVSYDGEGDARTCTISGRLRSDGKVRTHTSPPLGKVRPPKNAEGQVKGSPLWTKKPDVQLFYDTSRDWTRIYCPTATLGIFAPEEFVETPVGPENARDVTGLAAKLKAIPPTGEGFRDGHAERELSQIAPSGGKIEPGEVLKGSEGTPPQGGEAGAGATDPAATPTPETGKRAGVAPKPAGRATPKRHRAPSTPPSKEAVKKAADRAEERSAAAAKTEPAKAPAPDAVEPKAKKDLKTSDDYLVYAKAWIDASTDYKTAMERYDEERELRDKLKVPVKVRTEFASRIDHKFAG